MIFLFQNCLYDMYIHVCVYIVVCMCLHLCVYIHVYMYAYVHVQICMSTYGTPLLSYYVVL